MSPEDLLQFIPPIPSLQEAVFLPIAIFTIVMALVVVASRNLFHSALGLVGTFFGVAGIYALLEAEFLAVSQVMIYVGAIATLITFAVMLTRNMMFGATSPINPQWVAAAIMATLFGAIIIGLMQQVPWGEDVAILGNGEVIIAQLGALFVTTYLIPFQMMALLLLVALAGAIMLARDRR